jgi:hypothetical protein
MVDSWWDLGEGMGNQGVSWKFGVSPVPSVTNGGTLPSQLHYLPGDTSLVYTILVQKNITFSAAESDIERAREVARSEHRPLIDAFREWLIQYGSRRVSAAEVTELYNSLRHVNAGRKFTRDEMNER